MSAGPIVKQASSILEISQRYGIARQTLYDEIGRGNLKVRKIGKRSIILAEDERAWLDSLETLPAHPLVHSRKAVSRRYGRTPTNKQDGKRLKAQSVN